MVLRKLFQKRKMRKQLGATEEDIERVLLALDAEDPINEPAELTAIRVMAVLREERPEAYCKAKEARFDFDSLLDFFAKIIEMLMPFIIKKRAAVAPT